MSKKTDLRIKQLEAECAVMRETLESVVHGPESAWNSWLFKRDKALSTDLGKSLLAQLQAHRQALKEAKVALWTCKLKKCGYGGHDTALWFDMAKVEKALTTINSVLETDHGTL